MPMLEAAGLAKRYGGRVIVDDVALEVGAGEVVGLLGPNGAGKTTCFYIIVGLIGADAGSVRLDGVDITDLPMHARAQLGLGYLPQEASVFRGLSVADNVRAIVQTRPRQTRAMVERRTLSLLEQFNIAHLAEQRATSLSGGERRRLEIARALASEPRVMLLDEPFAGIDPIAVGDIRDLVRHLTDRGIGVLITDHNVRETLGICERAYIISGGSVIANGEPQAILADPTVRKVYLGEAFRM
ncbi:MAG: LPS export ABC transporter ATP-binding protein [Chromatiales bacterium]|nr:LPS export ABC transporter ATP-binding protein [Chromatiales bacterium]